MIVTTSAANAEYATRQSKRAATIRPRFRDCRQFHHVLFGLCPTVGVRRRRVNGICSRLVSVAILYPVHMIALARILQKVTQFGGHLSNKLKLTLEIGPKNKMVVAVAPNWPGLARGAKTEEAAIERLLAYLPRYAPVAKLARMGAKFSSLTGFDVVERYTGPGSTDFWGISFGFSSIDRQVTSKDELQRELTLLRASWTFFDAVCARVSAEMRKRPARWWARS